MTDQELKLELLKIAKAQNPHEMGNSPLEMAKAYYHWINDNVTFEEENMNPPGYKETIRIRHQVQAIIKTVHSDLQREEWYPIDTTGQAFDKKERVISIYKNAFNKLLEL